MLESVMHKITPVLLIIPVLFFSYSAHSRSSNCRTFTKEQAKQIAEAGGSKCKITCGGCGCKAGPGYRTSSGKCVSYGKIISECGPDPHGQCVRECFAVVSGCERPQALE